MWQTIYNWAWYASKGAPHASDVEKQDGVSLLGSKSPGRIPKS